MGLGPMIPGCGQFRSRGLVPGFGFWFCVVAVCIVSVMV